MQSQSNMDTKMGNLWNVLGFKLMLFLGLILIDLLGAAYYMVHLQIKIYTSVLKKICFQIIVRVYEFLLVQSIASTFLTCFIFSCMLSTRPVRTYDVSCVAESRDQLL